ncbi:MAG: type II toxin-antitoxin system RelE/ParE family toxin [Solirubrobacterales bacterium]
MSGQPWSVRFARAAEKDVNRLDPQVRRRVVTAIRRLAEDPDKGSLSRLTGRPESRLRIGDWRVILETDHEARQVFIVRVLPRGRVYDR